VLFVNLHSPKTSAFHICLLQTQSGYISSFVRPIHPLFTCLVKICMVEQNKSVDIMLLILFRQKIINFNLTEL
jgi:hypothetical protein